ncbi:MAG: hypothetical protein ABJA37_15505 [Ferruginibacter sp.]
MKAYSPILIFLIFVSCNNNLENSSYTKENNFDTVAITAIDTLSVIKEEPSKKIEEKYKAFNDIYFTLKNLPDFEKKFNKRQQLADLNFEVNDEMYDDKYGLYEFSLTSESFVDLNSISIYLERIYSIINRNNNNGTYLNETCKNCISSTGVARMENLMATSSGAEMPPLPSDDGTSYFKKVYNQDNEIIKIGYSIGYDYGRKIEMVTYLGPNGSYQGPKETGIDPDKLTKKYSIFLLFTCIEISSKVENKKNEIKDFSNEKDANKF